MITISILSGNPKKQALHYGEVFSMWSYLLNLKGATGEVQTWMNHTGDRDLKRPLVDLERILPGAKFSDP